MYTNIVMDKQWRLFWDIMASIAFLEDDLGCLFFVSTHTEGFLYRSFTVCDDDDQTSDFHAYHKNTNYPYYMAL